MKLKVFTDVHAYGPHEIQVDWDYGPDSYYLGDNVDVKWTDGRRIGTWLEMMDLLRHIKAKFQGRIVRGNHELRHPLFEGIPDYLTVNGVMLTHGDHLFWGETAANLYRSRPPVSNRVRRWLVGFLTGFLAQFFTLPIPKAFKRRAAAKAKELGCHTIICGHWHPAKNIEFNYDGVRVIVLSRGRHDLDLTKRVG